MDKSCRAGENRSQISRMALWPHCHSCSRGKQLGSGWAGKQVGEREAGDGTSHILLICDLFSPALQFLSKTALTLLAKYMIFLHSSKECILFCQLSRSEVSNYSSSSAKCFCWPLRPPFPSFNSMRLKPNMPVASW